MKRQWFRHWFRPQKARRQTEPLALRLVCASPSCGREVRMDATDCSCGDGYYLVSEEGTADERLPDA